MKKIRKTNSLVSFILTVSILLWVLSLALRGFISWGINGFAGYAIFIYAAMCAAHAFADSALSVKSDNFKEVIE